MINAESLRYSFKHLRASVDRELAFPVYLVLFVKGVCHAKCLHCFLPSLEDHHTASRELSLTEIEKLAKHLGPAPYSVLLAGGEPFLRKDLGGIISALSDNRELRAIKVVTNGFFTDRTLATWEQILSSRSDKYYGATMSFDGLRELHDHIRGVKGIFDKAIATFKGLKALERRYPNFEVDVNVTVSRFNQDHLSPLYDYLRDELHAGNVMCTVTRGAPNDPRAKDIDIEKYSAFRRKLEDDLSSGSMRGHTRFGRSDTLNAINITQRDRIERMLRESKYISPCNAGRLSAVIGSDGQVYACELLNDTLGDLRANDYDLMKVWNSPEAHRLRANISKTNCFCTYENANLLNVLYQPRYYPRIMLAAARMKLARLFGRRRGGGGGGGHPQSAVPAPKSPSGASLDHLILQ
jgi:MoaA/NifB/PqqE/SkfB family radical SAM enzyme